MKAIKSAALAGAAIIAMSASGHAAALLDVTGSGINSDAAVANGTTLWSLVGGVTTSTPAGDNGKNAILRYYVVASGSSGSSVFSLGEIDPAFGGTGAAPYVASNGNSYALVDPAAGASGRNVSNLTSLNVVAVPALPQGAGGPSTGVALSGLVANPGTYTLSKLQTSFTPVQQTVSGDTYTGVPLWTFVNPSKLASAASQIVVTSGTDGYEVVLSLAELDPSLGGNPANLLPYADTGSDFPGDGVARTILPLDNKHGRWVSDLSSVTVSSAVPEPSTWVMLLLGLAGLGVLGYRPSRPTASAAA
ncbi:MAG: PEP-CTERM sorting domain-containing protein [Xanthobacteraceae bacterium]|nr:PEP-CTERM sorting domain-containing protein [Xanthobacteraceae bacterium]